MSTSTQKVGEVGGLVTSDKELQTMTMFKYPIMIFSVYRLVYSKVRNRLGTEKALKIVFCFKVLGKNWKIFEVNSFLLLINYLSRF